MVEWLLEQTCAGVEQLQPLYFAQGMDFCNRTKAAVENPNFLGNTGQQQRYLKAVRHVEHQTLEQQYAPKGHSASAVRDVTYPLQLTSFVKKLHGLRRAFQDAGAAVHATAVQEVEQEREVAYEVEAVREVQKPAIYSPLAFSGLHSDVIKFVKTGSVVKGMEGIRPAFDLLKETALGKKYDLKPRLSKLFASLELRRTVSCPRNQPDDDYLRPLNWLVLSPVTNEALIIIPEEVELVIPLLQAIDFPRTHLISYAAPVTRKMLHFDNLRYLVTPPLPGWWEPPMWLRIELGILAGRLYFPYGEYAAIQRFLGVEVKQEKPNGADALPFIEDLSLESYGISPSTPESIDNGSDASACEVEVTSFCAKPLAFLQEYLGAKRKGQDFTHTPMGYVCQGKTLTKDHPFFSAARDSTMPLAGQAILGNGTLDAGHDGAEEAAEDFDGEGYYDEDLPDLEDAVDEEENEQEETNRVPQLDGADEEEL